MRLERSFYEQSTLNLAKQLLGKLLVRRLPEGIVSGWIVETEAYLWRGDPACHANRGMTERNRVMFGSPGTLYVYSIHAKYCMNIVTESAGRGAAVLIRAIEPWQGHDLLARNRGGVAEPQWTSGPGKLCAAMAVDRRLNGEDLVTSQAIWLETDGLRAIPRRFPVRTSPRIGISQAQERPWRFFIDGNRYVSGRAAHHSKPPREMLANNRT